MHGVKRDYHSNGQLAAETPYDGGLPHGVVKAWAPDGKLLGSYNLDRGSGISKHWYDNGMLSGEVPLLKCVPTGRQKTWYEDGKPLPDAYWIRGKQVSRKKYFEACKTDSELPKYPETKAAASRKKV